MSKTSKTRDFNPQRLDVAAFARDAHTLEGELALNALARLNELQVDAAGNVGSPPSPADLYWRIQGEMRPVRGGEPECWLHLKVRTEVRLQCQRCLEPMLAAVDLDRHFQFVADEATAAELDGDNDEADILVLDRALDLHELIEDEVLLALPIVPMHEVCPAPLPVPVDEASGETATEDLKPHPFAALAALKKASRTDD